MFDSLGAKVLDGGLMRDSYPEITIPVYLGIDQSYTGFAVTAFHISQAEPVGKHYTWCYASKLKGTPRLLDIQMFLVNLDEELTRKGFGIEDVAMEGYAFGSQMAHMLGELGGMVKMTLFGFFGEEPFIVTPTQLKKYATGRGNKVSKAEILLAVYKHWNVEYRDDNMADSYVLARIASGHSTLAYQADVVKKVQDGRN